MPESVGRRNLLIKNLLVSGAGQALGAGLNLVIVVLMARYLGAERYGTYAFALAFVGMFQLLASAGLDQILVREITVSPKDAPRLVGVAKSLTWVLSVATFTLIVGIVQFTTLEPTARMATYIVGGGAIATIHAIGFGAVFRAFEKMEVNAIAFVLHKVVFLVAVLVAAWADSGVLGMCVAFAVANVFNWAYHFTALSRGHFRPRLSVDLKVWRTLMIECLPLGFAAILRKISWHVDVVILMAFGMTHAVGYFTAGYKVIQALNLVPLTFAQVLFPVLSRTSRSLPPAFDQIVTRALKVLLLAALPLTLAIAFAADRIIDLAYGPGFAPAAPVLALTAVSLPFLFITSLYPFVFTAMGAQRHFTVAALVAVVVNVLVDLALVPPMAEIGASAGTLSGEITLFLVGSFALRRLNPRLSGLGAAWRPVLAALGMAAFLFGVGPLMGSVFVTCGLGIGIYAALLLAVRALLPREISALAVAAREFLRTALRSNRDRSPVASFRGELEEAVHRKPNE